MPFSYPIRIYWEDTDAGGIVFYANYLKFFERARTEWLRSLGVGQQGLREATGGMFVVTETSVKYHRPARLDDRLQVTARLAEKGRASLVIVQQAWLLPAEAEPPMAAPDSTVGEGTILLSEGTIRIGWVESATLRPARIPQHILELLEQ